MAIAELKSSLIIDTGIDERLEVGSDQKVVHIQFLNTKPNRLSVAIAKGASYKHFVICESEVDSQINVSLDEPGVEVEMYGLIIAQHGQANISTSIQHLSENGHSIQEYRQIIGNNGHVNFNVELSVLPMVTHNRAKQFCRNLLLAESAKFSAKPNLRIANDEVECSHGIASGYLNKKSLDYLTRRGITPKVAEGMLIHAFANFVISKLPSTELKHSSLTKLQSVL